MVVWARAHLYLGQSGSWDLQKFKDFGGDLFVSYAESANYSPSMSTYKQCLNCRGVGRVEPPAIFLTHPPECQILYWGVSTYSSRPVESHSGARETYIAGPYNPHSVCIEIETPKALRGRKRGESCPINRSQ